MARTVPRTKDDVRTFPWVCRSSEVALSFLGNPRYENEDGETNFRKGPPPKTTLMDFMTSLKLSNANDNDTVKERNEKRRYNNDVNATNNSKYPTHSAMNNNYPTDQITFQQEGVDEGEDLEDDSTHANHRERRNPLPPRYVLVMRAPPRHRSR
jgi:hypothetical protein